VRVLRKVEHLDENLKPNSQASCDCNLPGKTNELQVASITKIIFFYISVLIHVLFEIIQRGICTLMTYNPSLSYRIYFDLIRKYK